MIIKIEGRSYNRSYFGLRLDALVAPGIEAWERMYKTLGRVLKKNTARAWPGLY